MNAKKDKTEYDRDAKRVCRARGHSPGPRPYPQSSYWKQAKNARKQVCTRCGEEYEDET